MKKIIIGIISSLFLMSSAFAEPYKGKAFPEKQVVKWLNSNCAEMKFNCSYLGKKEGSKAEYNGFYMIEGKVNDKSIIIFQLDTGIWILQSPFGGKQIVQE